MSKFTAISFYTQDWEYPRYAQNLIGDCQRLGINYIIEELPSDHDYVKNCNKKPLFILSCLKKLKAPVLWIDADGSILQNPALLDHDDMLSYDIAGNLAAWDDKKMHVGSIWFNYTDAVIDILERWRDLVFSSSHDDDVSFNHLLNSRRSDLKIRILPREYFVILKSVDGPIPDGTFIAHRLSTGSSKENYKIRLAETARA